VPSDLQLRDAVATDAAAFAEIYAPEVLGGTSSYETDPPDAAAMAVRMRELVDSGYPWLVACSEGIVAGYAYATAYRSRPAYRWTVEGSVYVRAGLRGRGIGRRLLAELVARCTRLGYRRMIAVIGDESNTASVALHERAGFEVAARFPGIGYKHGRWLTGLQMQRALGDGDASPPSTGTPATAQSAHTTSPATAFPGATWKP
jgi:phosphinothricin acetyltransferase